MDFLRQKKRPHWVIAHTLVGVFALTCFATSALAADQYPPRVSHVEGTAAYVPAGKVDWEELTPNLPLLSGDRVFSHPGARVEIEFGEANFLRLGEETDLAFSKIDDRDRELELFQGELILRLGKSRKYQIFTSGSRVEIKKKGLYRIGIGNDGSMLVAVRKGRAEIENQAGKTKIKNGEYVWVDAARPDVVQVLSAYAADELDLWSDRRDARYVANQSVTYVGGTWHPGVYDLDFYGHWVNCPPYGNAWFPRVSIGWAPFRLGRWCHFSFGWTWVSHDPWGWLPYHYGRWVYYSPHRRWCWVPGGFRHWSPAMVHFYWGHGYVGWSPHGQSFVNNGTIVINEGSGQGGSGNPARGLTIVRREDFRRGVSSVTQAVAPTRDVVSRFRRGLPDDLAMPRPEAHGRAMARSRETPAAQDVGPGSGAAGDVGREGSRLGFRGSSERTAADPLREGSPAIDRILTREKDPRTDEPGTVPARRDTSPRSENRRVVRTYQPAGAAPAGSTSTRIPAPRIEERSPAPERTGEAGTVEGATSTRKGSRDSSSNGRITTIPKRSADVPRTSRQLESRSSAPRNRTPSATRSTSRKTTSRSTLSRSSGSTPSRSISPSRSGRSSSSFRPSRSTPSRSFTRPSAPRSFSRPSAPRTSSKPSGSRTGSRSGRSGRSGKN